MPQEKITVEIWSDIACPFCYIGKTNFEQALQELPERDLITVVWKSFQLTPDLKTDTSILLYESLAVSKGISVVQARDMISRVTQVAQHVGLEFKFDQVLVANTRNAHRLLHEARKHGVQNNLKHALLQGYFTDGKNIDAPETLRELAIAAGIDPERASSVINSDEHSEDVLKDIQEARDLGVSGVPFFVFDRKRAISGAQPAATFSDVLRKTVSEY